jgi:hypothetical protein
MNASTFVFWTTTTLLCASGIQQASAETITAKQARAFVNGAFGLTAMYGALAQECRLATAGQFTGRYGIVSWLGESDEQDALIKAATYHTLRVKMTSKLVIFAPDQGPQIDAQMQSVGGEAGLISSMQIAMNKARPELERKGFGSQSAFCAVYKSVVMATASEIGQPPQDTTIVP